MRLSKYLPLLSILAGFNAGIYSTALADTLNDAEQAIENKNYSTAIIHLKNQLRETPKNAHARFLLGDVYLRTGKLDSSLKELGRAHKLLPNDTNILFRYADALQTAGKQDKILKLLKTPFNEHKLESRRLTFVGYAHLGLQQLADALQAFEEANQLIKSTDAYNGLAALSMFEKDYVKAEQLIGQSLSIEPDSSSTLQLKAKLANINKQPEQAIKIYNQIIEKNPTNLLFRLERATTLTIQNNTAAAKADLKIILDKYQNHPQANFMKAQILLREKDYTGAQEAAQLVVNIAPKHMPAAFILGAANFALKNFNQAEEYLTIYLASAPNNLKAQNILANVYLAQGKTKQSLLIIEGIPKNQLENDPLLLVTLGTTYIQIGEKEKGLKLLNQAQTLAPDNQEIKKRLIAAQFKSGELEEAISELEELANIQTDSSQQISQSQTNYLLIISYIKQKQLDKANDKIDQLLNKTPDDLKLLNLKALVLQLNGDTKEAMAQYQAIIKLDKENIPAYMGMARINALEANWQESENHFKQVITIQPNALKAYLGLAAIAEKQNKPQLTEQYFLKAIEQSKTNIASQLTIADLLSQWYQTKQLSPKILELADKLSKQHPNDNKVRSFLARAQLVNEKPSRAERTLKNILTFDKQDIKHRVLLAKVIGQDPSRIEEAVRVIDDGMQIHPENQLFYTLKASLLINQKKHESAIKLARTMQDKFPDSNTGLLLEADIFRAQNQFEQALTIYQDVYKLNTEKNKTPDAKIFAAIVDMHLSLKQQDKAIILLTKAVDKALITDDDLNNLFKLASLHHEKQEFDKAEIYYLLILEKKPKHVITLNNLAWIKIDSNVKEAVQLAKQAHEESPSSAAIMDTYGFFLVRDAQYEAGLELLKKAANGIPGDKDIQYHLAFTYVKLGQQEKAREILEKIVNSKQAFSEQKKALILYQEIK